MTTAGVSVVTGRTRKRRQSKGLPGRPRRSPAAFEIADARQVDWKLRGLAVDPVGGLRVLTPEEAHGRLLTHVAREARLRAARKGLSIALRDLSRDERTVELQRIAANDPCEETRTAALERLDDLGAL